jgi:hypothetical protein
MFDPAVVATILAIAGVGVLGITEMIKRFLKAEGVVAYLISLAVSAAATVFVLLQAGTFGLVPFVGYTILVFLEANGIYKAVAKT